MMKNNKCRILGIDLGDSTIGIAMTDPYCILSQPFENYRRKSLEKDLNHLIDIILEYDVEKIVFGMPYNYGTVGAQAQKVLKFSEKLKKKIFYSNRIDKNVEFDFVDETMTSVLAEESLSLKGVSKKKINKIIDKMAAQIILEDYINGRY